MNGKAATQLGLGLMGLWVFVQSIWAFLYALTAGAFEPFSAAAVLRMILALALLGFSYMLVFRSEALATRFFPDVNEASQITADDPGRVAVRLLGLLLTSMAIPRLAEFAPSILRPELLESNVVALQRFALAGAAGQLALALWLIRRPDQALSLWLSVPEE